MTPASLPFSRPARAILLSTLSVLAACGSDGSKPRPAPLPTGFDLVFDNEAADGSRRIMRARFDGTPPQAVPGGEHAVRPHARFDGRSLVFTSHPTSAQDNSQLLLLENMTPPTRRLSHNSAVLEREIVYAPDGTRVAFVSRRDEPEGADVFVADLVAGELSDLRNLTPAATSGNAIDATPAWSPNGQHIAFSSYRNGGVAAVWTMRGDGTEPRQITTVPANGDVGDHFPVWSPDGTMLAFQRRNRDRVRIGLVMATGGQAALFDFDGKAFTPAWSPDGRLLAFSGEVAGELDLYVRSADGSDAPLRLPHAGPDRNPAWLPR